MSGKGNKMRTLSSDILNNLKEEINDTEKLYGVSVEFNIFKSRRMLSFIKVRAKNKEEAKQKACERLGASPDEVKEIEEMER